MTETEAAMAASALFILDLKGSIILYRDYRGDVPIKFAERFITKLNELEEAGKVINSCMFAISSQHPPLMPCSCSSEHCSIVDNDPPTQPCRETISPSSLYTPPELIMPHGCCCRSLPSFRQMASATCTCSTRICTCLWSRGRMSMPLRCCCSCHKLKEVFVHYFNELEEESLRDNFVIAYELLDEVGTSNCMNRYRISCICPGGGSHLVI